MAVDDRRFATANDFFRDERGRDLLQQLGHYFSHKLGSGQHKGEELLAQVYEIAVKKWEKLDPARSPDGRAYERFLWGIARKVVLQHRTLVGRLRLRFGFPRWSSGEDMLPEPEVDSVSNAVDLFQRQQEARFDLRLLMGLPAEQRLILHMAASGLTHNELGELLDITPVNARQKLHVARKAARELLETEMGGDHDHAA